MIGDNLLETVKPIVAITAGDPAGIGPEIARKAADDPRVRAVCEPVIYGPPDGRASSRASCRPRPGVPRTTRSARRSATRSTGGSSAIATAPVNKLGFRARGCTGRDTRICSPHLTHAPRVAMMFWSEPLKVVLATVHVPLVEVPRLLTRALLGEIIDLTARELPRFGIVRPRLALAGLNPHAGEEGLLGSEETQVLRPAVEDARGRGIAIDGPFPGDTIFGRAMRGEFDAVIACYHDQGLIPVKLLAFGRAVNVTLGLPIVRTSVDHGTAFDIAGKGIADPSSMIEAVLLAARLSKPQGQRSAP